MNPSRIDSGWWNHNSPPSVFVLTGVRCGSTLFKAMLDQHPGLFAPPELNLWPFETVDEAGLQFRHTVLARGLTETLVRLLGSRERAEIQVREFSENATPVPEIMAWIRQRIGDRMLVDKSPTYPMSRRVLERIERLGATPGTEPRYILLTRHPLDVFESMERNGFDRLLKILTANARRLRRHRPGLASNWFDAYLETPDNPCRNVLGIAQSNYLRAMTNCREFLDGIPRERRLTLNYESLVGQPEREMRRVCEFLGLAYEAAMLDPYGTKVSAGESVQDPNFLKRRSIDSSGAANVEKHERKWSRTELAESTREIARQFGYSLPAITTHTSLTPSQERFIADNNGPAGMYISMVQNVDFDDTGFDRERFERVVASLGEQVPALRAAFDNRDGCWIQRHAATLMPGFLGFKDLRSVTDADAREARITHHIEVQKQALNPEAGLLWRVLVFRTGERRHRVVYLFHHLIADGMSLLWFDRTLWQRYFDAQGEHAAPAPLAPDYPTRMRLQRHEHDLRTDLAFYQAVTETPDALADNLCRVERGRGPDSVRERTITMPLSAGTQRPGLHFDAVAVALHQAVGAHAGSACPLIAHRLARRDALRRAGCEHWMGWVAGDAPVRIDLQVDDGAQRRALRSALRALPVGGVSYDWLALSGELPALDRIAAVRLNYVPAIRAKQHAGASFALPDVRAHLGEGVAPEFPIDFLVREFEGQLEVIIRYAHGVIDELRIEALLARWRSRFEVLADAFSTRRPVAQPERRRAAV